MAELVKVAETIEQAADTFIKEMQKRDELQMIYSRGRYYIEDPGGFVRTWEVIVAELEQDRITINKYFLTTKTRHKIIKAFEEKRGVNNAG